MSTAHRPTFEAAKGRDSKAHLSQKTSKFHIPSYTKLKFRQPAASTSSSTIGLPSNGETSRRDLKRELEEAEWEAKNRKRVKAGLDALPFPAATRVNEEGEAGEDEETRKRKEAVARAIELDRDSDSSSSADSEDEDEEKEEQDKPGQQRDEATSRASNADESADQDSDSESDSEASEDDQDEETLLLRELEKIKAERAAEKARLASLSATEQQRSREEEIALGNPLLNLQNAFQPSPPASSTTTDAENIDFGVRRRWDDDIIFKNQASAAGNSGRQSQAGFVNDLTRSDFHKKFMNRYIK